MGPLSVLGEQACVRGTCGGTCGGGMWGVADVIASEIRGAG